MTKISHRAGKQLTLDHPVLHFADVHGFRPEFFEILLEVAIEQVIGLIRVTVSVNHLFHFGSFLVAVSQRGDREDACRDKFFA